MYIDVGAVFDSVVCEVQRVFFCCEDIFKTNPHNKIQSEVCYFTKHKNFPSQMNKITVFSVLHHFGHLFLPYEADTHVV